MIDDKGISQKERKAVLENDRLVKQGTYHSFAVGSVDDERPGRFSAVNRTSVTGAEPAQQYPRQPSTSPFASDPVPPEGPLGYNIDYVEPVGEAHEIASSLAASVAGDGDGPTQSHGKTEVRPVTTEED